MSLGENLTYLVIGNPISQAILNTASNILSAVPKKVPQAGAAAPTTITPLHLSEIVGKDYKFIRLAGLSGATAVIMGAYGKHALAKIVDPKDQMEAKAVFETANRFHFLHSVALLVAPLVRKPLLTGSLMAVGTILFSGTMYYRALTGDKKFVPVATCGGFCLIAAWLSLIF